MGDLADQCLEIVGRGRPPRLRIADHALRHAALFHARDRGQGLHHLQPRHADPQFAGDELEEREPLIDRQLLHPAPEPRVARFLIERRQRQEALAHPKVERDLLAGGAFRQEKRQRLSEIADRRIAFLDEPLRQPRAFEREAPEEAGRDGLARLAASEEIDRPGRARPLHGIVFRG